MDKVCIKCGVMKSIDCFYKHKQMADGHLNKCKECNKKDVSENYYRNREHYIKYEISRQDNNGRREKRKQYSRWLRKNHPDRVKRYQSKYSENKKRSTNIINNGLRSGKITKLNCQICGDPNSEGHHYDYSKADKIIWLCRIHHGMVHRKYNKLDISHLITGG